MLQRTVQLLGGASYMLSFDLAGNRRQCGPETSNVRFGDALLQYAIADTSLDYRRHSLLFQPVLDGSYGLSFANAGHDFGGAILDNVLVTSVSVAAPSTVAGFGAAAFALALLGRRRRVRTGSTIARPAR